MLLTVILVATSTAIGLPAVSAANQQDATLLPANHRQTFQGPQEGDSIVRRVGKRIFGGDSIASATRYPFLAFVRKRIVHFCTGSIISTKHVLTAAHCLCLDQTNTISCLFLHPRQYYVGVGDVSYDSLNAQKLISVVELYIHPKYKSGSCYHKYDNGILELARPLQFNNKVSSIRLPRPAHPHYSFRLADKSCFILGLGMASFEEKTTVHHLKILAPWYGNGCDSYKTFCNDTAICTVASDRHSVFYGDSGGPMVCNDLVVGTIAYGNNARNPNGSLSLRQNIITRIDIAVHWITDIIKGH